MAVAVVAGTVTLLILTSAFRLMGPFREPAGGAGTHATPCAKCQRTAMHTHPIAYRFRDWPRRPRPALGAQDWLPWTGELLPVSLAWLLGVGTALGMWQSGDVTTLGLGVVLSVMCLIALVVLHVRRPPLP